MCLYRSSLLDEILTVLSCVIEHPSEIQGQPLLAFVASQDGCAQLVGDVQCTIDTIFLRFQEIVLKRHGCPPTRSVVAYNRIILRSINYLHTIMRPHGARCDLTVAALAALERMRQKRVLPNVARGKARSHVLVANVVPNNVYIVEIV